MTLDDIILKLIENPQTSRDYKDYLELFWSTVGKIPSFLEPDYSKIKAYSYGEFVANRARKLLKELNAET